MLVIGVAAPLLGPALSPAPAQDAFSAPRRSPRDRSSPPRTSDTAASTPGSSRSSSRSSTPTGWIAFPSPRSSSASDGPIVGGARPPLLVPSERREFVRHRMKGMPLLPSMSSSRWSSLGIGVCVCEFPSLLRPPRDSPLSSRSSLRGRRGGDPDPEAPRDGRPGRALRRESGSTQVYRMAPASRPVLPVAAGLPRRARQSAIARLTTSRSSEGPTWYGDYGLYGMQYGAPQVFAGDSGRARASPRTTAGRPVPHLGEQPQRVRLLSSSTRSERTGRRCGRSRHISSLEAARLPERDPSS